MESPPKMKNPFEILQDRNAGQKVTQLAFSTKQDLIAYATAKAEVNVYNNDWMKVASYKAQNFLTGDTVSRMSWRPDGRALAIAYSSGKVVVKNVETHETLAELNFVDKIEWLDWSPSYWTDEEMTLLESKRQFHDHTEKHLQEIEVVKSMNSSGETNKEQDVAHTQLQMKNQRTLSILSVITSAHTLNFHAFGFFPIAQIDLQEGPHSNIVQICRYHMSRDFRVVVVVVKDDEGSYWELVVQNKLIDLRNDFQYDISIIQRHFEELEILAKHNDYLWAYRRALETSFKRLTTGKDDSRQDIEEKIGKVVKAFEHEFGAAREIRPEIGTSESPATFLLAALMEQLVLGTVHPEVLNFFEFVATTDLLKYETQLEQYVKNFRSNVMLPFRRLLECCLVSLTMLRRWVANEDRFAIIGASIGNFEQALQDCSSFLLKLFELQYVSETEARRYLTAVTWFIAQSEMVTNHDQPPTRKIFTEEDLDDVITVLQDLFGSSPTALKEDSPEEWRMGPSVVDAYYYETDLARPLDLTRSDFQPYYEKIMRLEREKEAPRPFLGDLSQIPFHPPPKTLVNHHPEKSARQECTAFVQSLELAFANVATTISLKIPVVRTIELVTNNCGKKFDDSVICLYPVEIRSREGEEGKNQPGIHIVCRDEDSPNRLVIYQQHLTALKGEKDSTLILTLGEICISNLVMEDPVIIALERMGSVSVLFLNSGKDGDIILAPFIMPDFPSATDVSDLPEIDLADKFIGFYPLNVMTGVDLFVTNTLRSVMAVVSSDTRLRLFRLQGSPEVAIVDDTDKIAEGLRPDLTTLAT